jgi:predicted hotdog family 3-hydroxylacyl-ACP dehydratase
MSKYDLTKIIPQRAPMIFLSDVEEFDYENQSLVARVDVSETDLLFDKNMGGIPSWASLEFMAQSVAAFVGLGDLHNNPDASPAVGFVLGSRKLSVLKPVYLVGHSYFIHVKSMFCDQNIASFDCKIVDEDNNVVAAGALNAFRPDDIKQFMESNNE